MLAICAALRWELRPLLRAVGTVRTERLDGVRVWWANRATVLLFQTGMGCDRAAEAAEAIFARLPVRAVINTGCAGALIDSLPAGALVIPDSIRHCNTPRTEFWTDPAWTDRLRTAARRAGIDAHPQSLVTTPTALSTAETKRAAHADHGAVAVEMEGSAVAGVASSHRLPFASARVVLDPLDLDLPTHGSGSEIGWLKTAVHIANPTAAARLVRLARCAFATQQTLHQLFAVFLRELNNIEGFV